MKRFVAGRPPHIIIIPRRTVFVATIFLAILGCVSLAVIGHRHERKTWWVEVILIPPQHVIVHDANDVIRIMPASCGKLGAETPQGVFRIQDRGRYFWSERYGEGAYYWVRFKDNYLFHSVPVDRNGNTIEAEKAKMGQPATHGCVRLYREDARWFYENVPTGTPVFIHE